MKVWALWEGGNGNYAPSDPERDLEVFGSIGDAGHALERRLNSSWMSQFDFVNRAFRSCYCPCVGEDTRMFLWFAADIIDGTVYVVHENGPDRILSIGPRGGIRTERG